MYGLADLVKVISGFGSSGHGNSTPPTTQSSGFDQNGGEYTQHLGDADCSITFNKTENGRHVQEKIDLNPSGNPKGTTVALTDAVMRTAHKNAVGKPLEYVKLSVTMRVLHTIYEGGMLQECGRSNPIHIEISSMPKDLHVLPVDDGHRDTADMIKENMRRNINMILTISIAGYDVGGRDGEYLSVLNDNYMQKQIRGYVGIHTDKGSSHTDTIGAKTAIISIIEGRINHYLIGLEKSTKNRTNSHQ